MALRYVLLLGMLCGLCGCGLLPVGEMWTSSRETDYFLTGGAVSDFSGAQADETALRELASTLMDGRSLYMGLYRHGGAGSSEQHQIRSGPASCTPGGFVSPDQQGSVVVTGAVLQFSFTLPPMDGYSALELTGTCALDPAQRAIEEVRSPKWGNNTSTTTVPLDWTLTGAREAGAFSLSFKQTLGGRSFTYSTPI
jgi:hypothetical protein